MLKILSGLSTNLPSEITYEHLYLTSDTQELYADINGTSRVRIGDIIKVMREADLPTLSAEENNKFYYIKETNQIVTFVPNPDGNGGKFEPVNNLESFGITLSPEEINQLKIAIDEISSKIENGEIGGGINFSYNSGAYNTPGLNAGKENWTEFANISKGKIYQLTDIGLLNPGLNNENTSSFTLNDLNNYSTEMIFLDRYSNGTILNKPETEPILTTIPTKYFTNWLKYAIENDVKSGKIDFSDALGKDYQYIKDSESTSLSEQLVIDNTQNFITKVNPENPNASLGDLSKLVNNIPFFNELTANFQTVNLTEFLQWFSKALANDINNGDIPVNLGSSSGGETIKHYKSIQEVFGGNDTSDSTGTGNLSDIASEMIVPSILRTYITKNEIDYPINGILEIYKTADYTVQVRLSGGINDLYILSADPTNWNEVFPERPIT